MLLNTLVPFCDSYHLFLCFRWAAVRCRRWLRFLWLHTLVPAYDIIYFFVSGGQQSDAGGGFGFCGYILWFLSMIVIIYFFVSGGQQSDAGGGLGFFGYILWFLSMIVIIYFFGSGWQQSDAGGGLGFCGYILWFISMIVIIYFFFWFRWAAVRCRRWLRFLWLQTLVYFYDCYHLFFLVQVGSSQMQEMA